MTDPEFENDLEEDDEASRLLAQYYEDLTKDNQNRAPGLWRLPRRHSFAHHYCFLLNDAFGHMIVAAGENLSSATFEMSALSEQERAEFMELEGENLIRWLEAHGQRDFVEQLFEKRVIGALVMDAAMFIYEALRCSEKGKLVVTFALLRKPLRENLLILELLLGDRARFFELFANDITKLGVYTLPKSDTARPIITKAVSEIRLSSTFDPEFLYDLRYAKHQHFSLESLWNKATHLVTGGKHFATESENFNFVFSDLEANDDQWDALYARLPYLLLYFVEVVESLMQRAVKDWTPDDSDHSQREVGFSIAGHLRSVKPFAESPLAGMALDCPLCGHLVLGTLASIDRYYWTRHVRCEYCGIQMQPFVERHYSKLELFSRQIRAWLKEHLSHAR